MNDNTDIRADLEELKRRNYYEWRKKQGISGFTESYEEWVERCNITYDAVSTELKHDSNKSDDSVYKNKRMYTVGGLKYINFIEKLIRQINGVYQMNFIPEDIDIIISSNTYYFERIKNEDRNYWNNIIHTHPNIEFITENDFLRSLGYDVPKDKDEKREDTIKMLNGSNIAFIGVLNYIEDIIQFCTEYNANCSFSLAPDDVDIIVMSDSYYKKFKNRKPKPKTTLEYLSNLSKTNQEIVIINENNLLTALGYKIDKEANDDKQITKGVLIYDNISDYTVIDLETTSKYSNQAEIIELAALKVRNGSIIQKYNTLIKPKTTISDKITNITGITN